MKKTKYRDTDCVSRLMKAGLEREYKVDNTRKLENSNMFRPKINENSRRILERSGKDDGLVKRLEMSSEMLDFYEAQPTNIEHLKTCKPHMATSARKLPGYGKYKYYVGPAVDNRDVDRIIQAADMVSPQAKKRAGSLRSTSKILPSSLWDLDPRDLPTHKSARKSSRSPPSNRKRPWGVPPSKKEVEESKSQRSASKSPVRSAKRSVARSKSSKKGAHDNQCNEHHNHYHDHCWTRELVLGDFDEDLAHEEILEENIDKRRKKTDGIFYKDAIKRPPQSLRNLAHDIPLKSTLVAESPKLVNSSIHETSRGTTNRSKETITRQHTLRSSSRGIRKQSGSKSSLSKTVSFDIEPENNSALFADNPGLREKLAGYRITPKKGSAGKIKQVFEELYLDRADINDYR